MAIECVPPASKATEFSRDRVDQRLSALKDVSIPPYKSEKYLESHKSRSI